MYVYGTFFFFYFQLIPKVSNLGYFQNSSGRSSHVNLPEMFRPFATLFIRDLHISNSTVSGLYRRGRATSTSQEGDSCKSLEESSSCSQSTCSRSEGWRWWWCVTGRVYLFPSCTCDALTFYAFSRRFYPKRLTVHSDYNILSVWVPWELNPQPLRC